MRKRNLQNKVLVEDPQVKARVLAVLQALSGEKTISQICEETGLKMVQYYKLESQMLKGMTMAAQSSLEGGRRMSTLAESSTLQERNQKLRQENLRVQSLLRLTKKLFKMTRRGRKPQIRRGRLPKDPKSLSETASPALNSK